jgi:F0F1-type ATP synthase assembly protein I
MPFTRPIPDPKPQAKSSSGRPKSSSGIDTLVQAEKLMQIAILLPSAAFIGWLLGAWLDSRLHQSWIGIAGIVFGGISGLVYVVRLVIATGGNSSSKSGTGAGKGNTEI